jgi:hypothetical protein
MTPSIQVQRELSRYFIFHKISTEESESFRQQGYLLLGQTLTPQGIGRMLEEVMQAWRREKGEFDANATWLRNALLPNIHHDSSLVRDFYFYGPVVDVAEALIGPNVKGATSQLTFKMRGNTQSFAWHQDNGYGELDPYNAISVLTALDECDVGNGCLWLVPGSHLSGQLIKHDKRPDEFREIRMEADESKAQPMQMRAGESLVMHGWTMHKSEGNHSHDRDRRILFLRYADADAVEVYNDRKPRLGRLLRGKTRFEEVRSYEQDLE